MFFLYFIASHDVCNPFQYDSELVKSVLLHEAAILMTSLLQTVLIPCMEQNFEAFKVLEHT